MSKSDDLEPKAPERPTRVRAVRRTSTRVAKSVPAEPPVERLPPVEPPAFEPPVIDPVPPPRQTEWTPPPPAPPSEVSHPTEVPPMDHEPKYPEADPGELPAGHERLPEVGGDHPELTSRLDRPDRYERGDRNGRYDRGGRYDRPSAQNNQHNRPSQPNNRPGQPNSRPGQQGRYNRYDRPDRPERNDRYDRSDRFDRNARHDRGGRIDRADRPLSPAAPVVETAPPPQPTRYYPLDALRAMSVKDLGPVAKELGIASTAGVRKYNLLKTIMETQVLLSDHRMSEGILEVLPDGYGFLRSHSYYQDTGDVYVSLSQVKRYNLRTGDTILGQVRPPREGEKYAALNQIESINTVLPEKLVNRKNFEKMIPIYPEDKFNIEVIGAADISCRVMDLFCPIGKGQRGIIVAPPKAGKTTLLKGLANSIRENHPEIILMVLLIDERPEEVTDMVRSVDGEVISSTFDEPIEKHIQVSKLILEKAKRLVEMDKDVVILLDSITRLARAYNLAIPSTGQTLSGGVNPAALYLPKKFFGAARNIENGGSLTIVATALVDTGSRLDDVIFEEFKGTGNLELVLDRKLFDRRIFPCIDIKKTGTRKEELLLDKETLRKIWILRKIVDPLSPAELMQLLIDRISKTKTNTEFLASMHAQET